jgi:TolA-binding protein
MNTPVPWRAEPESKDPGVAAALERARSLRPWPPARRDAFLDHLFARQVPRRVVPWLVALTGAVALVIGVAVFRRPAQPMDLAPGWSRLEWSGIGHVDIDGSGHLRRGTIQDGAEASHWAFLSDGTVRADIEHQESAHPFVVVTPHLRVVVVGTQFTVETTPELTWVSVERGRVRVEARTRSVMVGPGERISSEDPRLRDETPAAVEIDPADAPTLAPTPSGPPLRHSTSRAPVVATTAPATCGLELRGAERRHCLEGLSEGQGLPAQNALFQLGLLDREAGQRDQATADWANLVRRFPSSALAPDASSNLVSDLLTQGRYSAAVDTAEDFPRRFPADPRCAAIAMIRANLLREHLGRAAEAEKVYAEVGRMPGPVDLHEEALYLMGVSQASLGETDAAKATWQSYLAQFPWGRHRAEVEAQQSR